jgi:hypothetical protein
VYVSRGETDASPSFIVYAKTKNNLKRFTKTQERHSFSVMAFTLSTQESIDTVASS